MTNSSPVISYAGTATISQHQWQLISCSFKHCALSCHTNHFLE